MYSVLIVDDDTVFRTRMKSIMDWEKAGYSIIAEARNGKEAIEKIDEHDPDIVITDISMPIINGVELIDYVTRFKEDTSIIALSGYNDFHYVRGSLINGAEDYLLKNQLNSNKLLDVLDSVAEKLISKKPYKLGHTIVNTDTLIQEFMLLLISGCAGSREEIYLRLKRIRIEDLIQGVVVVVAEPDNNELIKKLSESDYNKFLYSVCSIMKESVSSDSGAVITIIGRNRILILIPIKNKNLSLLKENHNKMLTQINNNVIRFLDEPISFGVSGFCNDIMELSNYYDQALKTLVENRFQGKSSFIAEVRTEPEKSKIITLDVADEKNILDSLRGKVDFKIEVVIDKIFNKFNNCNSEDIQLVLAELLNIIIREMRINNLSRNKVFKQDELNYQTDIKTMNIPELKEWFIKRYQKLYQCLLRVCAYMHYNENTKKAIDYIEEFYHRNISLCDIAKAININSSYLSRLFKTDAGLNITDYLNKTRVEKATSLIIEGKHPLKEISYKVGIQNYNYFFRLFKKFIGVTPNEYKKQDNYYAEIR